MSQSEEPERGAPSVGRLAATFAASNLFATVLRLAGGLLSSRAVEPQVLGLFNGIVLVCNYAPFLQLGVLNGLNRELPYSIGKGDWAEARRLASAAQAWALLVGAVVALGMIGVGIFHGLMGDRGLMSGWVTLSVSGFMAIFGALFLQALYRTQSEFVRLARYNVIMASIALLLVALVWWWGFLGLCLRALAIAACSLWFLWRWRPLQVPTQWSASSLRRLATTGAPIFAVGQLYTWWATLDATLVLAWAGTRGLGLYALAQLVTTTLRLVPDALGQVVYPHMAQEYGRGQGARALMRMARAPIATTAMILAAIAASGWFAMEPVVRLVLPKYLDGVTAAQWTLLSCVLLAFQPMNNVFNVIRRQRLYGTAIVAGMACYVVLVVMLGGRQGNLTAFPCAMAGGRLVFIVMSFLFLMWTTRRDHEDDGKGPR